MYFNPIADNVIFKKKSFYSWLTLIIPILTQVGGYVTILRWVWVLALFVAVLALPGLRILKHFTSAPTRVCPRVDTNISARRCFTHNQGKWWKIRKISGKYQGKRLFQFGRHTAKLFKIFEIIRLFYGIPAVYKIPWGKWLPYCEKGLLKSMTSNIIYRKLLFLLISCGTFTF